MHIVVDANIIIGTGYGRNHQFRELLSTLEDLQHDLCVPKVVVEEVVGNFRETLMTTPEKLDAG